MTESNAFLSGQKGIELQYKSSTANVEAKARSRRATKMGLYAPDSRDQSPPQAPESPGLETFEGLGLGAKRYSSNPNSITPDLYRHKVRRMADPIDSAL